MPSAEIHVKAKGESSVHTIETHLGGFTVLVHGQGMKITVPSFVEVSCRTTIPCMEAFTQREWEWVTEGGVFTQCWEEAFDFGHRDGEGERLVGKVPPKTIEELLDMDPGVIHVAGMIVQGCEAMFEGKSVFFRNPETLLHPATERYICGMFQKMLELCGGRGTITKTEKAPEVTEKPKARKSKKGKKAEAVVEVEAEKPEEPPVENAPVSEEETLLKFKDICANWLSKFPEDRELAGLGNQRLTAAQLIIHVNNFDDIGRQLIRLFIDKGKK